jgi:hypothetical protein
MEFRINSDISKSPEFENMGKILASDIEKKTGNKISNKEACVMIKAIKDYAGSLSEYKKIRSGIPPETAKAIEKLISVSPKFEGNVYRGMSFSDDSFVKQLKTGSEIDMKGFSSWSSDKKHSLKFSKRNKIGVIIEMKNKSGVSITHLSKDYNEKEVLVSGKSKIMINKVVNKDGVYYVDAREI